MITFQDYINGKNENTEINVEYNDLYRQRRKIKNCLNTSQ